MKQLRKIILVLTLLLLAGAATHSRAQGVYFGIKGGLGGSDLTDRPNSKMVLSGLGGLFVGYQISSVWAIQAEAQYSFQGYKAGIFAAPGIEEGNNVSLQYIRIPMLAKLFLIGGLCFESGVSVNFLTRARVESSRMTNYHWFDLSIPIGLSYHFSRKFEMGARANIGTFNVDRDISGHNISYALTFGWRF